VEIEERVSVKGYLSITEGDLHVLEHEYDALGNKIPSKWEMRNTKPLFSGQNKIAYAGWQYVKSKGWDVSLAIATGNGLVSGVNAPANTDLKLQNELTNARYICPGDGDSRVSQNKVALYAIWPRAQGTNTPITEWGLFCNSKGTPITNKDSGLLISRIAYSFTRTSSTRDIEITWLIVDSN